MVCCGLLIGLVGGNWVWLWFMVVVLDLFDCLDGGLLIVLLVFI